MNKEHAGVGHLSDEQRARISRNFRAAKALLDRKRPRDNSNTIDSIPQKVATVKGVETPAPVGRAKRQPLSYISVNTPSHVRNFKFDESGSISSSRLKGSAVGGSNGSLFARTGGFSDENRQVHSSFQTPIKQIHCSVSSRSNGKLARRTESINGAQITDENKLTLYSQTAPITPSDYNEKSMPVRKIGLTDDVSTERKLGSFAENGILSDLCMTPLSQLEYSSSSEASTTMPTVFYEDFDDSVLAEIDALCESETKPKKVPEISTLGIHERNSFEDRIDVSHVVPEEKLRTDGILIGSSDRECKKLESRDPKASQIEGMTEEYAKYIHSLNDRQREAACSDIAIPLMIVAGPGSGKTSTMVGRVLMLLHEGIGPSHILAMTFTIAAASEMRDRIAAVAGKAAAKELTISTFHSFSLQLCRSHAENDMIWKEGY